ncbi:hypothetical protein K439DRAFT_1614497 [Ramaria rubella]|nr:hypothetical protein K439DRAFT_1614497 [Ramaria rubella]
MLFIAMAWLIALFAGCDPSNSTASQAGSITTDCNTTCASFEAIQAACEVPHCGCTVPFLQAQGQCLVCQATNASDAAAVQFLLDAEITQCHNEGIDVDFQLDLPPDAAALVREYDHASAVLRRNQTAFFALQVAGGHVGLVIVLAFAVFSRKVRRDPTFLNFCITWIFSSVVFSILLYRGTDGNTVSNSLGLVLPNQCLTQAALTEGAQVMTACSTLALVVQLWLGLRVAIHGDATSGVTQNRWTTGILLVTPYALFLAFALPSIFVGMVHITIDGTSLERVIPTNFYCTVVELDPFLQAVYGVTLGLLIITVIFDALIICVLYKHWWAFRHVQTKSAVSLSILLRVMVFSNPHCSPLSKPPSLLEDGTGDSLAVTFSIPVWVDMLQATIPLIGFLVLGVNSDMVNALLFWRRGRPCSSLMLQSDNTSENAFSPTSSEKTILNGEIKFMSLAV